MSSATPIRDHRRQILWQVWLPLGVSLVIFLGLAILAVLGAARGSSQVEHWSNISAVWVILPVLFMGLFLLAITAGSAYGLGKLLQHMPTWMLTARHFVARVSLVIQRGADAAAQPIIKVNTFAAQARAFKEQIFGK